MIRLYKSVIIYRENHTQTTSTQQMVVNSRKTAAAGPDGQAEQSRTFLLPPVLLSFCNDALYFSQFVWTVCIRLMSWLTDYGLSI